MSEKVFLDLTGVEKKSEVKELCQEEFLKALTEFLTERYTRTRQVGNTDMGFVIGKALDNDGFPMEVCMVVHGTVKTWYDNTRTSKATGKVTEVPRYDLDDESEAWAADPNTIKRKERLAKKAAEAAKE